MRFAIKNLIKNGFHEIGDFCFMQTDKNRYVVCTAILIFIASEKKSTNHFFRFLHRNFAPSFFFVSRYFSYHIFSRCFCIEMLYNGIFRKFRAFFKKKFYFLAHLTPPFQLFLAHSFVNAVLLQGVWKLR